MWHNPAHMQAGHAAAAKSGKTPKHLIPHLKGLAMKTFKGKPITGAATQMKPSTAGGQAGSIANAQAQIRQSPVPFQNPQGPLASVGKGPTPSSGTGASKNLASLPTSKAPFSPPLGLGQRKRKAHGAHRTHSNFYGTR